MSDKSFIFRVWDKVNHIMYPPEEILHIENQYDDEIEYGVKLGKWDKVNFLIASNIHIMQYTGYKDVNGVKIFEGDIVEIQGKKWEIFWDDFQGGWGIIQDSSKDYDYDWGRDKQPLNRPVQESGLKIIGNIYEIH